MEPTFWQKTWFACLKAKIIMVIPRLFFHRFFIDFFTDFSGFYFEDVPNWERNNCKRPQTLLRSQLGTFSNPCPKRYYVPSWERNNVDHNNVDCKFFTLRN